MGSILNLPVIHLDQEFWQPGWVKTESEIWLNKVSQIAAGDKWIIDGTYDTSLDLRLPRADTVIFLDFPTLPCLWRIAKRIIGSYHKIRPDMAPGCPEQIDFEFIKFVWNYRKDRYPNILENLEKFSPHYDIIILKNDGEIGRFLAKMKAKTGN